MNLALASGRLGSLDMLDSASQAAAETRIRKVGLLPLTQRKPAHELHSVNLLIRLGDKSPGRARWARAPLLLQSKKQMTDRREPLPHGQLVLGPRFTIHDHGKVTKGYKDGK